MYLVNVDNLPRMWRLSTTYAGFSTFRPCVLPCFPATLSVCCVGRATAVTKIFAPFTVQCSVRASFVFTQIVLPFFADICACACAVPCCVVCVRFLGKKHRQKSVWTKSSFAFAARNQLRLQSRSSFILGAEYFSNIRFSVSKCNSSSNTMR